MAVEDEEVVTTEESPSAAAALLSSNRLTCTPKDWTCPCSMSFVVRRLSNCSLTCDEGVEGMVR